MKQMKRSSVVISAVAMTLSVIGWTSSAHGQYRINQNGHANDANNRIGSGGYNGDRTTFPDAYGTGSNIINNQVNNQIVAGNVTGLKYFHGATNGFEDPNAVQTSTNSNGTDRFLAISGPQDNTARTTGAPNITPFYTNDRLAVQAPNYTSTPDNTGVIPKPSSSISNQPNNDTRLGIINTSTNNVYLPTPGELDLPGPVDASGTPSTLIASPLYGMRQWSATDASDAYFMSRYTNVQPNGTAQAARASNGQIQQMRDELNNTMVPNQNQNQNGQSGDQTAKPGMTTGLVANNAIVNPTGNGPAASNGNLNSSQQLNSSLSNSSLSNQPLNSSLTSPAVGANLNADTGTRQQLLTLVPPSQQSEQLKDLEQRLAQSRQRMSPSQAAQAYNEENRLNTQSKEDAEKLTKLPAGGTPATTPPNGTPDATPPGMLGTTTPGSTLKPGDTLPPTMNPILTGPMTGGADKSYMITSLATGIKAQGLATLLKTAEDQMRQGKFSTALNTYDTARQVAPNNPFATLGQAFAELGAASYGRAEMDLRQSFQADSGAVLLGTYDLRGFLGEDRLKFVVKDLKDINAKEKNERAAFLLAYIAHNLGDDESAAKLLNDAEQRAGGNDSTLSLMRDSWQLKK
jgi:hypothetical protein